MVFLICLPAAAGQVELSPSGKSERVVKPGDFVTLSFSATNNTAAAALCDLSVALDPALSVISELKPVSIGPGEVKRIVFTVSVSGAVDDRQAMPVTLKIAPPEEAGAGASAVITLVSDAKVCASMDGLPDSISSMGRENFTFSFNVTNCGSNPETYTLSWEIGKGMVFTETPSLPPLAPGESATATFSILPTINTNDYVSIFKLRVLKKKFPVAEKSVKLVVKKPVLNKGGEEFPLQYIRINADMVNLFAKDSDTQTSLHLVVPAIAGGGMSFQSDMWLDNVADTSFKMRQQLAQFGYKRHGIIIGNQQAPMSEVLNTRSNLDGFHYTYGMGAKGWLSYFKGDDEIGGVRMLRWDRVMSPKLSIGYENVLSETWMYENTRFRANSINAQYHFAPSFSMNGLLADSKMSGGADGDARSERKLRLGANFNANDFNSSVIYNSNPDGFSTNGQQEGLELSNNYYYRNFSFSHFLQKNTVRYRFAEGGYADVPYKYEYRQGGWGKKLKKPGVYVYAGAISAFYNTFNDNDSRDFRNVYNNTYTINIGRQISRHANISIGEQRDNERSGGNVRNSRRYDITGNYNRGQLSVMTNFVGTLNFAAVDSVMTAERVWHTIADYRMSSRNSLHFEMKKEYRGFTNGDSQSRQRNSLEISNRLTYRDELWAKYEQVRERGYGDYEAWTMAYTRRLGVRIPYKKYGSFGGTAFLDRNFDSLFNADDLPMNNIVFSLDDKYFVTSEPDGSFEFVDMAPGLYKLSFDPNSFPIGVYPAATGATYIAIKSSSRSSIQFPFQFQYRIGGAIQVDKTDDYFSKQAALSPAKIRVLLIKDGNIIAEAFTDREGRYYFENLERGVYRVAYDPEWIPRNAVARGVNRYIVACGVPDFPRERYPGFAPGMTLALDIAGKESGAGDYISAGWAPPEKASLIACGPAEPCDKLDFTIAMRGKEIIKTYSF